MENLQRDYEPTIRILGGRKEASSAFRKRVDIEHLLSLAKSKMYTLPSIGLFVSCQKKKRVKNNN